MLKVAITGPESTGKSTLATQLAAHYNTIWVPEFARTYIAELPQRYTPQDIENIARGQLTTVQAAVPTANKILFADTDLLVIKIWFTHAFGYCPAWILAALEKQDFDLYLLMDVDLPWQADEQREHPHLRQFFYDWYKKELELHGFPFVQISGSQDERLQNALTYIEPLVK
ncbi:ATP-binding protein [Adhaeribacter rhizoryzae]|uniref:ATP-binding protein n=1 Tax=Adhaeribacter rhizoryzae TaxID=2607907 RepID=A0A5M6DQ38_9BACT|nr:ATP-binding protein [Adhaeribacter rhizoryzae]